MGQDVESGVIAIRDENCDPEVCWRNSPNVREAIKETIAWTYGRFFFYAW